MAHHKRRKRKSSRAGCICCKPWKANGMKNSSKWGSITVHERRARAREREQLQEIGR